MIRFVFTRTARYPGFEVPHYQFLRNLRTAFVNFKYRGFISTTLGILAIACSKFKLPLLQKYRFYQQNMDQRWLDTDGIVELKNSDIPDEFHQSASRYEAASDYEFRDVLERLAIDYGTYNFIDYGSGKGAILAAAARYPFNAVTGIELSQALHDVAVRNIAELGRRNAIASKSLTSVQGDATGYHLPAVPHIIYVFNSFGAEVLQAVLDRITTDLAEVQEPVYFLYNNPMHHIVLDESAEFQKFSEPFGGKWMIFVRKAENPV